MVQSYVKRCKYCNGENLQDAEKCSHCGRFFVVPTKPQKGGGARLDVAEWIKNPVLISAVVLFVSLFFDWVSGGANAFTLIKGFGLYVKMTARSGGGFMISLARAFIILIPVGCVMTVFFLVTGRSYRMSGILTGALPLATFLALQIEFIGHLTSFMAGGFFLAIISGGALAYFARREG